MSAGRAAAMLATVRLALRMLARDWRAGEQRVLAVAVVVAVASLTTVAFFADRVSRTLTREASQLLGADLVVVSDTPLAARYRERAQALGLQATGAVRFPSMAQAGNRSLLAEVKAVEPGYPLRGRLRIRTSEAGADVEPGDIPAPGTAWVDDRMLRRLDLRIGDRVTLGRRDFTVAAQVSEEPESSAGFLNLGPRLMFNAADLASTGLIQVGSRVSYRLFVAGADDAVARFRDYAGSGLLPGQRVEDIRQARPEINSALSRAERFLGLSSLLTVILAGVAIALAARRYLQRHLDGCAVLRCLGASQGEILGLHLVQFAVVGALAAALGCLAGFACQHVLAAFLGPLVQVALPEPSLAPAIKGMVAGFVLLVGFALPPLIALRKVPTLRVLRRDLGVPDGFGVTAYVAGGAATAALILWQAQDLKLGAIVLAGAVATMLVCGLFTLAVLRLLGRLGRGARFDWRYGLANLRRRRFGSTVQVVGLGLGLMALTLLTLVRADLLESWQRSLPADAPNRFLVNVQPDQAQPIAGFFTRHGIAAPPLHPMVRGRLVERNGKPVSSKDYLDDRARRLVDREFNLSWTERLPPDNVIVEGRWFGPEDAGRPVVSMEEGIAQTLGFQLGDRLTYDIAGTRLTVTITSLRKVEWDTFRVNFFVVAPPGVLEKSPASYVTSFHLPAQSGPVMDALVRDFPNLLVIDVAAILAQVQRMMEQVVRAVEFVFLFSLAAGLLVLFAAVASTHDERVFDAAVLRTLGASSGQLRAVQAAEFLLIGAAAGLLAAAGASAIGYALARQVLNVPYQFNAWALLGGVAAGALGVMLAGLLGTAKVLRTPPMQVFRQA
jgi:putative ABC transport system permease protein